MIEYRLLGLINPLIKKTGTNLKWKVTDVNGNIRIVYLYNNNIYWKKYKLTMSCNSKTVSVCQIKGLIQKSFKKIKICIKTFHFFQYWLTIWLVFVLEQILEF